MERGVSLPSNSPFCPIALFFNLLSMSTLEEISVSSVVNPLGLFLSLYQFRFPLVSM